MTAEAVAESYAAALRSLADPEPVFQRHPEELQKLRRGADCLRPFAEAGSGCWITRDGLVFATDDIMEAVGFAGKTWDVRELPESISPERTRPMAEMIVATYTLTDLGHEVADEMIRGALPEPQENDDANGQG
jgi:hypothetical protein